MESYQCMHHFRFDTKENRSIPLVVCNGHSSTLPTTPCTRLIQPVYTLQAIDDVCLPNHRHVPRISCLHKLVCSNIHKMILVETVDKGSEQDPDTTERLKGSGSFANQLLDLC